MSTSTSAFRASELRGMGGGRPISLATIGLTVFFPVPGVPQIPMIPRTPGGRGRRVKRAQEALSICRYFFLSLETLGLMTKRQYG